MSLINPIFYTILGQKYPTDRVPLVEVTPDSAAYGTIDIRIPTLTTLHTITCQIFRLYPPSSTESRWRRLGNDLYTTSICSYSYEHLSSQLYRIAWEFDPSTISLLADPSFFSIEFFVNQSPSATIPQATPKLIMKVQNYMAWTGETGFYGYTGLASIV
jgi:hypothetical protein